MWWEGLLRPPHLCWANQSCSPRICPITAECGWVGDGSTPSSQIVKLRPRIPRWGPQEKKKKKNPNGLPRGSRSHAQSFEGSHFSRSHPQPAAFAMETVLPPSSEPPSLQCILENAVHLRPPSRGRSSLRVQEGLQVPEGCARTQAIPGGCGLDRDPGTLGRSRRVRGRRPPTPVGGLLGGARGAIGYGGAQEAGP